VRACVRALVCICVHACVWCVRACMYVTLPSLHNCKYTWRVCMHFVTQI